MCRKPRVTRNDPSTTPRFLNQTTCETGVAHGGIAAAMADAAVAIQRHFGGGRRITTVESKIN